MREDHDDLKSRRITVDGERTHHEPPRVLLEIGHVMFLLPKGTNLHDAHAAAALLTRALPVTEDYETQAIKPASPCRVRFSLIAPALAPDAPEAATAPAVLVPRGGR